jgi:hypothetical protein
MAFGEKSALSYIWERAHHMFYHRVFWVSIDERPKTLSRIYKNLSDNQGIVLRYIYFILTIFYNNYRIFKQRKKLLGVRLLICIQTYCFGVMPVL